MQESGRARVETVGRWPYLVAPTKFIKGAARIPGGEEIARRLLAEARRSKQAHGLVAAPLGKQYMAVVAWLRRKGRRVFKGACIYKHIWEMSKHVKNLECLIVMDARRTQRYLHLRKKRMLHFNLVKARRLGIGLPAGISDDKEAEWEWHPTLPAVAVHRYLDYSICCRYGSRTFLKHADYPDTRKLTDFHTEQDLLLWILSGS